MESKVNRIIYLITDVFVWDNKSQTPEDFQCYTGIRNDKVTSPFVPDIIGVRLDAIDINSGIGGDNVGIYVKYVSVDVNDSRELDLKVITGIQVQHWPHWNAPAYSNGWCRASGSVRNIQGALTAGTDGACWRNGLAIQYMDLGEVIRNDNNLIMNLFMSVTDSAGAKYPKMVPANEGLWPMLPSGLDIHRGCGDSNWYNLIYSNGKIAPPIPDPLPVITDSEKCEMMQKFAPYVYMDKNESYFPSTVEFTFPYLNRYLNSDGNYWVKTKEELDSPSSILEYFKGDLNEAKVYVFWVEKEYDIMEATYFFYYPYNRGKEILNTIWGNHVGDWEHVTVRFGWNVISNKWSLSPIEVYLSAHDGGNKRTWDQIKLHNNSPIVYSAKGSHAMYFDAGPHTYKSIPILGDLTDYCSEGSVLDCSLNKKIVPFDYSTKKGLAGDDWPSWMSNDFKTGGNNPLNPSSGGIFRWGNEERGCEFGFGQCRLENGPTGPISKGDVWNPKIFE